LILYSTSGGAVTLARIAHILGQLTFVGDVGKIVFGERSLSLVY
jgi:hypothetical protein